LLETYIRTHQKSQSIHQRAVDLFAGDGATHVLRIFHPFRPYIVRAEGSHKWDVDGNEYIDYTIGHGALLLGHSHPAVVKAVQEQMAKGVHYGENHELEVEFATLIKKMVPSSERIEFCASGQEANMLALRLARLYTKRRKILRLEHHYHGWADELAMQGSAGIIADEVLIVPSNDIEILEEALRTEKFAALLCESGGAVMSGRIPLEDKYTQRLPDLAGKYGTLFILDEVVTGFREAPGGWQEIAGIRPDLTTLGKCLAGGLTVGAVTGRQDIMEAFSSKTPHDRLIIHGGTWNGNPLICAAGIAACKLYETGIPQRKAREAADLFRRKGNTVLKDKAIQGYLYGRSIVHFYLGTFDFEPQDDTAPPTKDAQKLANFSAIPVKKRLCLHLLQRGIATKDGSMWSFSAAHSTDDIEKTVEAFADTLDDMIAEGSLSKESQ